MPKPILTCLLFLAHLTATLSAAPVQFLSPFAPTAPAAPEQTQQSVTSLPGKVSVNEPDAIWRSGYASIGDWDGFPQSNERTPYHCHHPSVYEAEVFGSIGNGHGGDISDGLFDIALDLDLERITSYLARRLSSI